MKKPSSHGVHVELPTAPANVPGSHGVGSVAPAAHAWPRGHSLQSKAEVASAVLLKVPASQSSAADAPSSQYRPSGQARQLVALATGLKLPASHGVHSGAPATAKLPGLHMDGASEP